MFMFQSITITISDGQTPHFWSVITPLAGVWPLTKCQQFQLPCLHTGTELSSFPVPAVVSLKAVVSLRNAVKMVLRDSNQGTRDAHS